MELETLSLKEYFKKAIRYKPYDLDEYLTGAFNVRFCDFCGKAIYKGKYDGSLYWCKSCVQNILLTDRPEEEWREYGDETTKKIVASYNEALDELGEGKE